MKTKNFLLFLILIPACMLLSANGGSSGVNKIKVAVIGFEENYFTSNYYLRDHIARKTGIKKDSIQLKFNSAIINSLASAPNEEIQFIPVVNNFNILHGFYNSLKYKDERDKKIISLEGMTRDEYNGLLGKLDADYILFITQYEINFLGKPFNTNFHVINYNILNQEAKVVYTGKTSFESTEIVPLDEISSKISKAMDKIAHKTEKILAKL